MEYVNTQGVEVPALGFGTYPMKGEECRNTVETALDLGYRHIDTAQMYENEEQVGQAIAGSGVDREEIFLVTKILRENLAYEDVHRSVEESLDRLGTEIDLLLIHSPNRTVPLEDSIRAMNELQNDGSVKHIGVSNFSVSQMEAAIDTSETPILTNQVKYHPFNGQDDILEFCIDNDSMLTAYSPVARQRIIGNDTLQEIGNRYGKTEAQVALRWLIQQRMVSAIPKATKREHQKENIDIFDFQLTEDEMNQIFQLQGGLVTRLRNRLGL
jgi:diketogulonate reductase-like aldo/keto reductase